MENIKLHYWLIGIFTSIILIFAMSHNASAINFDANIENYSIVRNTPYPAQYCAYTHNVWANQGACQLNRTNGLNFYGLKFEPYSFESGDLFSFYMISYNNLNISPNTWGNLGFYFNDFGYNGSDFLIDSVELIEDNNNILSYFYSDFDLNFYCDDAGSCQGTVSNDGDYLYDTAYRKIYRITGRTLRTGSLEIGFKSAGSSIPLGSCSLTDTAASNDFCGLRLFGLKVYRYAGSDENAEQKKATEDAVEGSENAGNSSSQNAQSGTTGLLNAINGAISVITSASPTNCKINGNMGNLDIGQIDLCANPVPAFIQTIGSLLLILMCVPLAISLFNRFIALFRSFQS